MSLSRRPVPVRLALAGLLTVLATGCSVEDTPRAADGAAAPPAPAASFDPEAVPSPRPGEATDPCTQLALIRLDGQLGAEPSAGPEDTVRANEVVQEFVERYDKVLVASGIEAARDSVAADVAAACKIAPGEGNVVQIPVEEGASGAPVPSPTG